MYINPYVDFCFAPELDAIWLCVFVAQYTEGLRALKFYDEVLVPVGLLWCQVSGLCFAEEMPIRVYLEAEVYICAKERIKLISENDMDLIELLIWIYDMLIYKHADIQLYMHVDIHACWYEFILIKFYINTNCYL